jgi:nicotinate-nucleotide pyrophosphorylase (carboxylating)
MRLAETPVVRQLIELAVAEDCGFGDITSEISIPESSRSKGYLLCKQEGVLAGLSICHQVFQRIDPSLHFVSILADGAEIKPGDQIGTIEGLTRSILVAERTALNFLQHLSGIATLTAKAVKICTPYSCRLCDTRKTIPGWRLLEKYAVRIGGGVNHRLNLSDGILIKDNHIKAIGSITDAVSRAKHERRHPLLVEIEVTNHEEAAEAVSAGADALLLDNMTPPQIEQIVREFGSSLLLEASGNITLANLELYAKTGVHIISTGFITHSAPALDLSLKIR